MTSLYIDTNTLNVGIGTRAPTHALHIQGNAKLTGGFVDASNQPIWIPASTLEWKPTTSPPALTLPTGGAFTTTTTTSLYRYFGRELSYTPTISGIVTSQPTMTSQDYLLSLPYPIDSNIYPTPTIVGELWLNVQSGLSSNTFKSYARTIPNNLSNVTLRALTGTTDESLSTILATSRITLQGNLTYATPFINNLSPISSAYLPATFAQDQTGKVALNTGGNPPRAQLDIITNSNTPALIVDQQGTGNIAEFLDVGVKKVVIDGNGNVGIGTNLPKHRIDIPNGNIYANSVPRVITIDLTAQANTSFFPLIVDNLSAVDYATGGENLSFPNGMYTHYFSIEMPSQFGSESYNMHSLHATIRGQGWSDQTLKYEIYHNFYQSAERSILGIYQGAQGFHGVCIYLRGGKKYQVITRSLYVNIYTNVISLGQPSYQSTFAIKNASGTDISGTSAQISQVWDGINTLAGKYISEGLNVNGPIKNINPCFQAHRDATSIPANSVIVFQTVLLNIGSGYNNTTGVFTAPITGVYRFQFHSMTNNVATYPAVYIRKNGSTYIAGHGAAVAYAHVSASCVMELTAGNTVDIFNVNGYAVLHPSFYSCFSGHYIG